MESDVILLEDSDEEVILSYSGTFRIRKFLGHLDPYVFVPSDGSESESCLQPVLRIRIRIMSWIRRIHKLLGLLNPDQDPLVRGKDPDPSIIKQN